MREEIRVALLKHTQTPRELKESVIGDWAFPKDGFCSPRGALFYLRVTLHADHALIQNRSRDCAYSERGRPVSQTHRAPPSISASI